jgi:hypothetical protein
LFEYFPFIYSLAADPFSVTALRVKSRNGERTGSGCLYVNKCAKYLNLPKTVLKIRKHLEFFMLQARSLRIEFVNVTSGIEVDIMSQCLKQLRPFGSYCATTRCVVVNAEKYDAKPREV